MSAIQILFVFAMSFIPAIIIAGVIVIFYNIFIGIPLSIIIVKQKKYKSVIGSVDRDPHYRDPDEWREGSHWYTIRWEIDNKKYKRMIHTSEYLSGDKIQLYYLNPKYAMPIPRELAKYRYEIQTILLFWIICFIILIKHYSG